MGVFEWTDEMKSAAMKDAATVVEQGRRIAELEAALRVVAAELDGPLTPVARVQLRAYVLGELKRLKGPAEMTDASKLQK